MLIFEPSFLNIFVLDQYSLLQENSYLIWFIFDLKIYFGSIKEFKFFTLMSISTFICKFGLTLCFS